MRKAGTSKFEHFTLKNDPELKQLQKNPKNTILLSINESINRLIISGGFAVILPLISLHYVHQVGDIVAV